MKQGTTARIAATILAVVILAAAALLAGSGALHAQPRIYYGTQAYYGGRFAPPPLYAPDPAMSPYEVAGILRSRGYLPLGGPARRGGFYLVSAVHPNGDHGRVVIDVYTGSVVRFLPASEVVRASRSDEMVLVYQGPTFPPPDARMVSPPPSVRGVPRPPASVPRVASRTPFVTPKPRPPAAPQSPETAQAPPVPAPVETKPAAPSPPLVPRAVEKTPSAPIVQPTKPLPPIQTME